jgi:ABC-type nitrate/sulfonate/bicarbonate transport system substrate-binding protein
MRIKIAVVAALAALVAAASAQAETIKVAAGQRGTWDSSVPELGVRGGIFKKHGKSSTRRAAARPSRR